MFKSAATPYPNEVKPQREPGMSCPLMGGKDVSKVCHKCDFYQRIRGKVVIKQNPDDPGEWFDHWACTIAHSHMFMANLDKRGEDGNSEMERLANETAKSNANLGTLMRSLGSAINTMIEIVASTRLPQDQPSVLLPASAIPPEPKAIANGHAYEPEPVKQLEFGV
jgi:hypothetical protein